MLARPVKLRPNGRASSANILKLLVLKPPEHAQRLYDSVRNPGMFPHDVGARQTFAASHSSSIEVFLSRKHSRKPRIASSLLTVDRSLNWTGGILPYDAALPKPRSCHIG
jgi:hypothetical protein